MQKRAIAAGVAGLALVIPVAAEAHVTVQPPEAPAGSFTRLDVRVPNETDNADTVKVEVEMPDGFYFASYEPVPGWTVDVETQMLDDPVEIEEGFEATEEVTNVTFEAEDGTGIPPGAFQDFGLSVLIPEAPGETLAFPALQTYDDGEVVRWVGPADADEPAATLTVDEAEDDHHAADADDEADDAEDTEVAEVDDEDDGNGLAIAALLVGGLGFLFGGASLARSRKS
ncbi:MAG TPA: YcnI family protein [Solirubrobacterales bacterium]|nr:YcnI family protein [Solirubrobacterales bacterium]